MPPRKIAVILFNLGGPDRPEAIRPFLINLFSDPAILRVPFFIRPLLARLIARLRLKPARANYALLGGSSPLLALTEQQGQALAEALALAMPEAQFRHFTVMRYWAPRSGPVARAVRDWDPDEILLLPLYPQYSTTTTGSSLSDWREAAAAAGLMKPVATLCCYHSDGLYLAAIAALVGRAHRSALDALAPGVGLRVLFSAHGLPQSIVTAGDPYQFQVERSVAGVVRHLGIEGLEYAICYQSRATPQKWLDPSTEAEIERAAHDRVAVLVVPIAFVSEHSETLVELDIEYRALAERLGVPAYFRVPAPNSDPAFIEALSELVQATLSRGPGLCSFVGGRTCPAAHRDCPHARAATAARPRPALVEAG